MKIAVVMLVLLGIVAAGAATMFIQSTSLLQPKEPPTFDVLVATTDLAPRTLLTEAQVEVKKMRPTGLSVDYLSNWSQAAGKMLKVAVVKGQPLASSQFIPKNSIDDLLKPGMLAFPAPLSGRSAASELLYPGCIVDVFATFPLSNRQKGEAVVTPLLQNIQVLAVADDTVIPPAPTKKGAAPEPPKKRSAGATVTLEVTARQAAALQLAMEKGTLSLAMRNPNDKGWNPMEPMVIKEGQLTAASEALDPQTLAWVRSFQRALNPDMADVTPPIPAAATAATAADPNTTTIATPAQPGSSGFIGMPVQKSKSSWPVEVIRGQKVDKTELEVGGEGKPAQETPKETGQ